jgi:hypothetical protein
MRGWQKIALLAIAIGALSFLFVVVCPETQTPEAVMLAKGKMPSAVIITGVVAPMLLAIPLLPAFAAGRSLDPARGAPPSGVRVLDLTCVRLC